MKKFVFIGTVDFSHALLERLMNIPELFLAGIVTQDSSSTLNSDFCSLKDIAEENDVPLYIAKGRDGENIKKFVTDIAPDIGFCCGWSYLLDPQILKIPPLGFVGYHPSALPKNGGRHPLIWALALGLKKTASTFFQMTENADAGPILDQKVVFISPHDNATSLYEKSKKIAVAQLELFVPAYISGDLEAIPQDLSLRNTWRRRGKNDGKLDWRMTANAIDCLVKSLSKPYPGAHFELNGTDVKVWHVAEGPSIENNFEPGKILKVQGNDVLVKCWNGSVWLQDHELTTIPNEGEYLI